VRKLLLVASLLLCASRAGATITGLTPVSSPGCNNSTNSCSITIPSSGAGDAAIIWWRGGGGNNITAVSGGGTWTIAANCASNFASRAVNCAYILSMAGGTTTVSVTFPTINTVSGFVYQEFSYTGSSMAVDVVGTNVSNSTSATTQTGLALTLGGSNDVIVQAIVPGLGATSITTYGSFATSSDIASASLVNTTSGTAPTWTLSGSSTATTGAIALKEMSSGGSGFVPQIGGFMVGP